MRPAARQQAVIDLLTALAQGGLPADRVFERWARGNRYAGSKDRRFIGEVFFTILRNRRHLRHAAGLEQGDGALDDAQIARLLVVFYLRLYAKASGDEITDLFDGSRFAPAALSADERHRLERWVDAPSSIAVRASVPAWAEAGMAAHLGEDYEASAAFLCHRATIDIRVNSQLISRAEVQEILRQDDIETEALAACATALRVIEGRSITQSAAFQKGLIEIQDLGSQIVSAALASYAQGRVLDYCAGAGGKALALADMAPDIREIAVYDANPSRMRDLWRRAERAGVTHIQKAKLANAEGSFNLVLADVPCSGSGRWRRNPEQKWMFSAADLQQIVNLQAQILTVAAKYVRPNGYLAYITCSVLEQENVAQIQAFCAHNADFQLPAVTQLKVSPATFQSDGLYACVLQRRAT